MTNIIRQAHPLHDLAFQGERTGKLHSLFLLVAGLGGLLDGIDVGMIALALLPAICHACESRIEDAGGINLQILCIGTDGHTGFCGPTFSTAPRKQIRTLMRRTREQNARFFGSAKDLSLHVITMDIVTLMEARQCLPRDFGESGTAAIAEGREGLLAASGPAPNLQMHPPANDCLSAAARFTRRDYYQWVRGYKPEWRHVEIC